MRTICSETIRLDGGAFVTSDVEKTQYDLVYKDTAVNSGTLSGSETVKSVCVRESNVFISFPKHFSPLFSVIVDQQFSVDVQDSASTKATGYAATTVRLPEESVRFQM